MHRLSISDIFESKQRQFKLDVIAGSLSFENLHIFHSNIDLNIYLNIDLYKLIYTLLKHDVMIMFQICFIFVTWANIFFLFKLITYFYFTHTVIYAYPSLTYICKYFDFFI